MPADKNARGLAQYQRVCAECERLRQRLHDAIGEVATEEYHRVVRGGSVVELASGIAMALIIEAGTILHTTAPDIGGTAWEAAMLDVLRGAIRGAGHAVDERGLNKHYTNA